MLQIPQTFIIANNIQRHDLWIHIDFYVEITTKNIETVDAWSS